MGELVPAAGAARPASRALSPEVEAWQQELAALWASIGMSMNRFAAGNPIDKGTISRYLSGKRVPRESWFLNRLLAIRAEQGREVSQEVREHLTRLQLAALEAASPGEYRVRVVSDQLEVAEVARREAERYVQALHEQLADRQREVDELTRQQSLLREAWDTDRRAHDAERQRLQRHIDDLNQQITELVEELAYALRGTADAEQVQQDLERLLEHATAPAGSADPYTAAVMQLRSADPDVRLGGIYALDRIACESPSDNLKVIDTLASHIRKHSPVTHPHDLTARIPNDLPVAMAVLSACNSRVEDTPLAQVRVDLHDVDLHGVDLHGVDLHNVDLHGANLNRANLGGADLRKANLSGAYLLGAHLKSADLSETLLRNAYLFKADLRFANLRGALLHSATLTGADLDGANLDAADLTGSVGTSIVSPRSPSVL